MQNQNYSMFNSSNFSQSNELSMHTKNQRSQQVVNRRKQKFTKQSIQKFKIQIDHEIAKCLDTVDRQALKYIRQTSKVSNIFSSKNLDEVQQQANHYQKSSPHKPKDKNGQKNKNNINKNKQQSERKKNVPELSKNPTTQNKNKQKNISKNSRVIQNKDSRVRALSKKNINAVTQIQQQKKKTVEMKHNRSNSTRQLQTKQQPNKQPLKTKKQAKTFEKQAKIQQHHAESEVGQFIQEQIQAFERNQIQENISLLRNNQNNFNNNSRVKSNIIIENKQTHQQIYVAESLGPKIKRKLAEYNINENGPTDYKKKQKNMQSALNKSKLNNKSQKQAKSNKTDSNKDAPNSKSQVLKQQSPLIIEQQAIAEQIQQNFSINYKKSPQKENQQKAKLQNYNSNKQQEHIIQVNSFKKKSLSPEKPIKLQGIKNPLKISKKDSVKNLISQERIQVEQKKILVEQNVKNVKLAPQEKSIQAEQSLAIKIDDCICGFYDLSNNKNKEQCKSPINIINKSSYQDQQQDYIQQQSQIKQNNHKQPTYKQYKHQNINQSPNDTINQQVSRINSTKPSIFINKTNSLKKKEKKEKASLLYSNSNSKSRSRIKFDVQDQIAHTDFHSISAKVQEKAQVNPSFLNTQKAHNQSPRVLKEQRTLKMQKIDYKQPAGQSNFYQNINKSQLNKQQEVQKIDNNILKIYKSEVKMLNVNKKKSVTLSPEKVLNKNITKLKFKVLSNRGNSTLFGLTGIQLYTIDYKRVILDQKQLKQNQISTGKLLQLFNKNNLTTNQSKMFKSYMTQNTINVCLSEQNSKIGGIKIFNFNKSSLQSDKQVFEMEIYHNDQKIWKGQINQGSYNQYDDYSTKIEMVPNFKFEKVNSKTILNNSSLIKSKILQSQIIDNPLTNDKMINQIKIQENSSFMKKSLSQSQRRSAVQLGKRQASKYETNYGYQKNIIKNEKLPQQSKVNKQIYEKNAFKQLASIKQLQKRQKNLKSIQKTKSASKLTDYNEFDLTLKGLQQNVNRQKSKSKLPPSIPISINLSNNSSVKNNIHEQNKNNSSLQNKNNLINRSITQRNEPQKPPIQPYKSQKVQDDFMNDSLFHQKPQRQRIVSAQKKILSPQIQLFKTQQNQYSNPPSKLSNQKSKQKLNNNIKEVNIDDFLGQLEDMMGNKKSTVKKTIQQKDFYIPNLPQGKIIQIQIYENWGHPAFVGLKGIQFIDQKGKSILPINVRSTKNFQSVDLTKSVNSKNIMSKDQVQTKLQFTKNQTTKLTFQFNDTKTLCLIRIWNYYGHRINSNMGIKYCCIKLDQNKIFMGQFRKNQSGPESLYKSFQPILFTKDNKIISLIKQNDWINDIKKKIKEQKLLLKSTLLNFNRPKTKNNQQKSNNHPSLNQNIQNVGQNKQIKVPKRMVWQCQSPQFPKGNIITFFLHNTWGNTDFIGLNGIQIFDKNGNIIGKESISLIKAFPNSTGEKNDKRVIQNLLNGKNLSSADNNIWLSTFQSGLQKLQSGKGNTILIQLSKTTVISGINIFNYSKTPDRGVREIQIQINNIIVFRGYLKIHNPSNTQNAIHTTINFTKDIQLLRKMNYESYTEDNYDQNVDFINQKRIQSK